MNHRREPYMRKKTRMGLLPGRPEGWGEAEEINPKKREDKDIKKQYLWFNLADNRWEYDYTEELQACNLYLVRDRDWGASHVKID